MWKKLPQSSRSRNLAISTPTLIETTYDNDALQSMSGVNTMRGRQADRTPGLPPLTLSACAALQIPNPSADMFSSKSTEPSLLNADSTSHKRVASSIYSRRISFTDHQYSGGDEIQSST